MSEKENKKSSAGFWKGAQELLCRPVRARSGINLSKLANSTKDGQSVLVADKILGNGYITHKVVVAALGFSERARSQIAAAGGEIVSVEELKKRHPKGDGVVLVS